MNKTVLVTGIGGNVGYGILKNIRSNYPDFALIGTNTTKVSPGNHMCNSVYEVPFSTHKNYIPLIGKICVRHHVDLIIPGTDYESYVLAAYRDQLPTVATSGEDTNKIFLDKYLTYEHLNKHQLPFAESILPGDYKGQFHQCIVKPREGRGSRDIHINPQDISFFSDEYMVQPLLQGPEITTAFYLRKDGSLHGHITMNRSLAAGATSRCEVTAQYDAFMEGYILDMSLNFDIKGSCNIQSIVTENGIVPFEVNCRISGTNSIREHFGFRDVCYTIEEYLLNQAPQKALISPGAAIRILSDIIYPGKTLAEIDNISDHFFIA